jgi:hypothetical protein
LKLAAGPLGSAAEIEEPQTDNHRENTMKIRILALALLLASSAAFASVVDGKWAGSIDTPNGAFPVSYEFKSDGNKVTGTTLGMDGMPIPLKNVKVDGNMISFSLDLDFGQGPTTFNYTGVVSGAEMKIHSEFMGQPIDFSVKKTT